jgi:hypothetical protein
MKCPHCLVEYHSAPKHIILDTDVEGEWSVFHEICPNHKCKRLIVYLTKGGRDFRNASEIYKTILVRPKSYSRSPLPKEVPDKFANDYKEACSVLSDSSKASAALSRRCLQNLLREVANVKKGNLYEEIQQVIDNGRLPSYLTETIDTIRSIGKFAAHPNKSQKTGEIIDVEPGEAEWCLAVLEGLFDFYFVQPAIMKAKKDALNAKLQDAKQKPKKQSSSGDAIPNS